MSINPEWRTPRDGELVGYRITSAPNPEEIAKEMIENQMRLKTQSYCLTHKRAGLECKQGKGGIAMPCNFTVWDGFHAPTPSGDQILVANPEYARASHEVRGDLIIQRSPEEIRQSMMPQQLSPTRKLKLPPLATYSQQAFVSIVPCSGGGGYYGVYREFTPEHSDKQTEVRGYALDENFEPIVVPGCPESSLLMAQGEDPRAFVWKGEPWALVKVFNAATQDWDQWLVGLERTKYVSLRTSDIPYAGKNWMPVTSEDSDRLFIIRSLDPLCILEVIPQEFRNEWEVEVLHAPKDWRHIGEYRGGGAAHWHKTPDGLGYFSGYGHRTETEPHLAHTPFKFTVSLDGFLQVREQLDPEGFGHHWLIDPTGQVDGNLVVTCSSSSWWHPQTIENFLCKLP